MTATAITSSMIFTVENIRQGEMAKGLSGQPIKTYNLDVKFGERRISFVGYGDLGLVFQTIHALGEKFKIAEMNPGTLKAFKESNADEQFHGANTTNKETGDGSVRVFSVKNGYFINPNQTRVISKISKELLKLLLDYALDQDRICKSREAVRDAVIEARAMDQVD